MNIDTNIVIAYLAKEQSVIDFIENLKLSKIKLFISAIVEAELTSHKDLNEKDLKLIRDFISEYFVVIPIDRYTLNSASYFRRSYPKLKSADSCVLSVSKLYDLDLISRDAELLKIKEVNSFKI